MIVDKEAKIIFVRHQKTASTSIMNCLSLGFIKHKKLFKKINESKKFSVEYKDYLKLKTNRSYDPNHVPLCELKNIAIDVYENRNEYFKFGFTRNPWDRMISSREYLIRNGYNWVHNMSLSEFLKCNYFKKILAGIEMNTVDFCDGCDFIGRFENLQEDFNIICDKIGIQRQQLPHKNKTKHKHYTEYYDDETREIVKRYAKDIEHFGYKFGE